MGNPGNYQFDLPRDGRPAEARLVERWYPGIRESWQGCTSRRIYDPILGVRAIVIHATAGTSSAGAASVMADGRASFHWLVPDEDEWAHGRLVWACAPEARTAWHVRNGCSHPDVWGGRPRINHYSLGLEIVNAARPEDGFSRWQVEAAARIVRYAWAKYPNLVHVVSHARLDPGRRSDPGAHFPWERFRDLVFSMPADPALPVTAAPAESLAGCGELCPGCS